MRNILIAALVLSASAAQAQDCDSVRDTFNRNISTVNATLAASPTDDIAYQAWIDLQVNGEWLLQHNCNVDRKKLNEILGFARQINTLGSLYRANDRLLNHY
jgi:hypothetical protein